MIMRLENIQVGRGQYLYKTGRCIWDTKGYVTDGWTGTLGHVHRCIWDTKGYVTDGWTGTLGHVHRLIKGEQNEEDNEHLAENSL